MPPNLTGILDGCNLQDSPALLRLSLSDLRAQIEREDIENAMKDSKACDAPYHAWCMPQNRIHTLHQFVTTDALAGNSDRGIQWGRGRTCECITSFVSMSVRPRRGKYVEFVCGLSQKASACMHKLIVFDCRRRCCGSTNTHPNPLWIF